MSDAECLTKFLVSSGATRDNIIAIINEFGDPVDWGDDTLVEIIGEVADSDENSGDSPEGWIINEILRRYNLPELKEEKGE